MRELGADPRRTPLYEEHVELGARLVPFAGFAMPVQYAAGIRAEHRAVRTAAGLFDVSHMGEFRVRGPDVWELVSYVTTNDPARLAVGQAQYSVMCLPGGGIVDDLLVYRMGDEDCRLVVNAANEEKDWQHLSAHATGFDVEIQNESEAVALLALQGPAAREVLQPLTPTGLDSIRFYHFLTGEVAGISAAISRTGYTGEDGFELYVGAAEAPELWRRLLAAGEAAGLQPAGLGARDTLRLEMGYALYGNDIDEDTSPLEAGLGWLVKLEKGEFVGRDALRGQKENGVARRLRGFRLTERGFPRSGYDVVFRGETTGTVRSGTLSPTLEQGIGTTYLPSDAGPGDPLAVRIRDREVAARVVKMPFYSGGSLRR
ncbi:MAG: glycine cleavage system aminomethyltransferase GcvT [Gemmatimonadota bacterium]